MRWIVADSRRAGAAQAPQCRAKLWFLPLDGKPPRKLTDFGELNVFSFALASDGKSLAMARGVNSRDAVLITGFRRAQSDPGR